VKRELEQIEIPAEHAARERAWAVASTAFAERQLVRPRSRRWRPLVAVAAALAVLAAVASEPGRAVLDSIRDVVGVERAQPALFSLPTAGRLLVASDARVWVVQQDGSKRLLGDYREASWSPFGRFVVAARENELAALEPDGNVRWTLARPGAHSPRWTGTETDTRIAYLGRQPRIVAGDGTGDETLCAVSARRVAPAWQPHALFAVALAAPSGAAYVLDVDGCITRWASEPTGARRLEWSSDGARLLVVASDGLSILNGRTGAVVQQPDGVDASFRPGTHELARIESRGDTSAVVLGARTLFRGAGELRGLAWSPDGRWLLMGWPAADQWVLVRADDGRIRAVGNVSEQFRSHTFPRVEGWCCDGD
jgi:hypothetical protein